MLLYDLTGTYRSELTQALMTCVMLAQGGHIPADRAGTQTGYLDIAEMEAFRGELKKYETDHSMVHYANRALLSRIIRHLGSGEYQSLVIIDQADSGLFAASINSYAFDDLIEARDQAAKQLRKLEKRLEQDSQRRASAA